MVANGFIIIGERRSGSSSLYSILKQHPDVNMSAKSDSNYFIEPELFLNVETKSTVAWESNHSVDDFNEVFKDINGYKNADLLWWTPSHKRLSSFLPNAKFIIVLRNPVNRAISQYFNELKKGRETLSFEAALERENNQQLSDWQKLHLQYKERGCYIKSINKLFEVLPKERVKIVILEEMFENWDQEINNLCEFLNISTAYNSEIKYIHSNKEEIMVRSRFSQRPVLKTIFDFWDKISEAIIVRITSNKDKKQQLRNMFRGLYYVSKRKEIKIDSKIIESLKQFYKPFNKQLEVLLNKELKHWN